MTAAHTPWTGLLCTEIVQVSDDEGYVRIRDDNDYIVANCSMLYVANELVQRCNATPALIDGINALLGLLQLLERNPLTHPEIVQSMRNSHRVQEAKDALALAGVP